MKKKGLVLIVVGILAVSGISFAYGISRNDTRLNTFNRQMMSTQNSDVKSSYNNRATMLGAQNGGIQSKDNFNNMIKIMKDNGFTNQANAMESRDFNSMDNLMNSLSDEDYKKMIDIMQNNGYGSMANMMQSVSREDRTIIDQCMMRR